MFSLIHIFTLVLKLPIEFALFMSKGIMFHNWVPLYNAKSVVHSNVVFPSPRPNSYFPTLMSCKPVCQVHWFLRLHCRHYIVSNINIGNSMSLVLYSRWLILVDTSHYILTVYSYSYYEMGSVITYSYWSTLWVLSLISSLDVIIDVCWSYILSNIHACQTLC